MLTAGMTPGAMRLALDGGAAGVILKQTGSAQLLEAIHRVARGETLWSAASIDDMRTTTGVQRVAHQNARNLTDRQRLVLRGILDGLANKEIAANLDASETSIKASIQELFAKGGVRTRSQLVRVALERFSATWLRDQP
jgi:DNA-binding NarL/FixJ family response regulator